jgi:nicotinate-nucleotide adenylyltransferase
MAEPEAASIEATIRRVAFFGGSFDPPHRGHLELADAVVEEARLDRLFFVPAARNPLKALGPRAPGSVRVAMLEAAIRGKAHLGVIDWELGRPPPSHTLDTVRYLESRFPAAERYWLIGADQLPTLPRWHAAEELVRRVRFLVMARPGAGRESPSLPGLRCEWLTTPEIEVSSTEVRARLEAGLPVDNLVPLPVLEVLRLHPDLYRPS